MTQDQVIEVLRKVIAENSSFTTWTVSTPHLVALVNHAIEAEREACAEVCNKHANVYALIEKNPTAETAWAACIDNRDEIKARGQA